MIKRIQQLIHWYIRRPLHMRRVNKMLHCKHDWKISYVPVEGLGSLERHTCQRCGLWVTPSLRPPLVKELFT